MVSTLYNTGRQAAIMEALPSKQAKTKEKLMIEVEEWQGEV